MNWNMIRIFLMIFWLFLGIGFVFREPLSQLLQVEFRDSSHYDMLGYLTLAFAFWNFARWYMARSIRKNHEAEILARKEREQRLREREAPKAVTDPQFGFMSRSEPLDGDAKR